MTVRATVRAGEYEVVAEGGGAFEVRLFCERNAPGLAHVTLEMRADAPVRPEPLKLSWRHPLVDTHMKWFPGCDTDRTLLPEWRRSRICRSRNTLNAPIYCLAGPVGRNVLTFAFSDALEAVSLAAGVVEETADALCEVTLFEEPLPPTREYRAVLRLDTRPLPYSQCLREVAGWWAAMPGMRPSPPPEHARLPMYSSWYSFHQRLEPAALERECRLARSLGMESVIVDDGWQTTDNSRGYAYCGDWEAAEEKFPRFAEHVARVHDVPMKYILWFSVPFVGVHSRAYARFRDMVLNAPAAGWFVLDPRFPEVREYLIALYEDRVRAYGLDGVKLDFVDTFEPSEETRDAFGGGRDIDSVSAAVDRLLTDAMARLRAINPDVLVEFRQSYVGPMMRKYGNMFRAGDVPADFHGNRVRTLDIRLLCGDTPAHSDMVMWHPRDGVASAAMQLAHSLFSVPQVSVMLDRLPADHIDMLRTYLAFWRSHRDVLLDGDLRPLEPAHLYPAVVASGPGKLLAAAFAPGSLAISEDAPEQIILVNATFANRLILDLARGVGRRTVTVTACTGEVVRRAVRDFGAGLHAVEIPPAGTAVLAQ